MIASLRCLQRVRALAEHHFEIAEREKLPTRRGEVSVKAKLVDVIIRLNAKIFDSEDMSCVNNLSIFTHIDLMTAGSEPIEREVSAEIVDQTGDVVAIVRARWRISP